MGREDVEKESVDNLESERDTVNSETEREMKRVQLDLDYASPSHDSDLKKVLDDTKDFVRDDFAKVEHAIEDLTIASHNIGSGASLASSVATAVIFTIWIFL